jgi:hypothetical protein
MWNRRNPSSCKYAIYAVYGFAMPRPVAYPIKKLIGFDPELWEQIREYRFNARLNTDSDAVRRLIEESLSRQVDAKPSGGSDPGPSTRSKLGPSRVPRPRKPAPERKAEPAEPRSKLDQIRALREQGAR